MSDECNQVSGMIVNDVQQRIFIHNEIQFLRGSDRYRCCESARGVDRGFDVRRNLGHIRTPALEQYIAAVQQRADVRVPKINHQVAQIRHREAFVTAHIDAANEGDAFTH